ncbi:MAG: hypothetical protein WA649_03720, partial [Methylovirgula sp.]
FDHLVSAHVRQAARSRSAASRSNLKHVKLQAFGPALHSRSKGDLMKLLISALVVGLVGAAPTAEAACVHHHGAACHRHYAHRHYRHYAEAGVVVPPPPPPGYATFDQPLAPLGWSIGDPDWRERNTLKLLMDNIGDIPYNR